MTVRATAYDVIIIGAGAAGLMCAMTAGQRGRKVLLIEHTDKPGAKILISGGGRCNFTNLDISPDRFLSANPHFCTSALKRYTQHDFIALVKRHGIAFHEKTLGQLFCDASARAIVDMLVRECAEGGVDVRLGETVSNVTRGDGFAVETATDRYAAPSLVLATGGLSIPKMGATGFAYDIARQFGVAVTDTAPALVPLKASMQCGFFDPALAGVSFEAITTVGRQAFREAVLFTHRGMSGPAILQISSYWKPGEAIVLDLLPGRAALAFLQERKRARSKASVQTVLSEIFPARLAQALASAYAPTGEMANIADRQLAALAERLHRFEFLSETSEGYAKAEVTRGGIDTRTLSSKTMEVREVPGLYAIGEAVDVTGWLGGYNFQWAWSSGWSAGQAV